MNVVWLSCRKDTPGRGYWDQTLLEQILVNCNHYTEVSPDLDGAVVIIPGAYQGQYIDQINQELAKLQWCLVIITSDEENNFPIDSLKHDNMVIFADYPNDKYKNVARWLPIGPARQSTHKIQEKTLNWSFAGQITHPGREAYAEQLRLRKREKKDGELVETKGFAQGLDKSNYHLLLGKSKVVPAPAGPCSPDSFRLYEAIEAGAVPIPPEREFWLKIFSTVPFPTIDEYEQLNGYIDDAVSQYPMLNNEVQVWWLNERRKIKYDIFSTVEKLSGANYGEMITVIIPVSPIKSHPDTSILDETIASVRHHLPDAEIIITFDGVREEQKDRSADYEEFKRRVLWKCFSEWNNVLPIIFEEHTHQVGMAKEALTMIDTPLLLYVEQDTPLTTDMEIDWDSVFGAIEEGLGDMVRFHFESRIPKEHQHMMLGTVLEGLEGDKQLEYIRTCQWSQRPHVASVAFYRRILDAYFTPNAVSFIEDKMHGVAHESYIRDGLLGWNQFRILIYTGDVYGDDKSGNIKRSYHTDGRAGEQKYDDTQVF